MKNYRLFEAQLVPIRVGMIPNFAEVSRSPITCPHTRGDDPIQSGADIIGRHLSPYAWG